MPEESDAMHGDLEQNGGITAGGHCNTYGVKPFGSHPSGGNSAFDGP